MASCLRPRFLLMASPDRRVISTTSTAGPGHTDTHGESCDQETGRERGFKSAVLGMQEKATTQQLETGYG
ncbi:hypothetical protein BDQ12DRAFT_724353 [Crucibulum laeve]|uniref:Uncharacterized protein n=1 Tax=Crucibulum laeve TaxID=68775 RepID=A0A5C3LW20_9AGAR|nr:hypothetical protein BDQ12DRAFT_724353 [Crucibulum laeve]